MTLLSLNTARANGLALVAAIVAAPTDATVLAESQSAGLANIAASLEAAENAAVPNVLAYGTARSIRQFGMGHEAASLDKADKAAIGFKDLPGSSPAKRRLSQYHSAFRTIAEAWDSVPQSEKDELFAGKRSFLTVRDGIIKREKAAQKAADEAAAAKAAEAALEAAKAEGKAEAAAPPSALLDLLAAAKAAFADASDDDKAAAFDMLGDMVDMANAWLEASQPAAIAA